ncbi:hypothetical protein QQP08_001570 [Theobroma cacao]|nr:hypothetical protein QQP08_001570 [Theobroma cacao]
MNVMKLNPSVCRWFRYQTTCFPTSRRISPCSGYGSTCGVSCKNHYRRNLFFSTGEKVPS